MHVVYLLYLLHAIALVQCAGELHHISQPMTWADAQQYCREHYGDLATLENEEDVQKVNGRVWIGLSDDPASWKKVMTSDSNSWRWSATGTTSPGGFQSWSPNDPNNGGGNELCVFIQNGLWSDANCDALKDFICYTVQPSGSKDYILINTKMTWTNAQSYCRQHHHDLAVIETSAENQAVANLLPSSTTSVWIGLYRIPWRWSDGNPSTYRNWPSWEPNNSGGNEFCVVQVSDNFWNDYPCHNAIEFVCQTVKTTVTKTKITLETTALMSDPAIQDKILKMLGNRLGFNFGVSLSWSIPPVNAEKKTTYDTGDVNYCIKGKHSV